jgi:hypothetical protein
VDVFGKGTDEPSRPLLPPGTCWVCENSPQQEAMKVIDTRRNSRAGGVSKAVSERKYVCEPCAKELGQAVGQVSAEEFALVNENASHLADLYQQATYDLEQAQKSQTRVVSADEIADVVSETVRAELAKTVKKVPATKTKPAAPLVDLLKEPDDTKTSAS